MKPFRVYSSVPQIPLLEFIAPDLLMVGQRLPALCDLTDEAIASTMGGFNEAWRLGIIAQSLSQLTNGDFEDGFANKGFWPDGAKQFLFSDQLARMSKEVVEHREHLRPELDRPRTPP